MSKKDLQEIAQRIINRIVKDYQPEKIILFGSAATGKIDKDSDLDLAIIKQTKKRFYDRIGEVLHLLWSNRPTPGIGTDVLVYTPQEFAQMQKDNYFVRDEIVKKGRILYEKQPK